MKMRRRRWSLGFLLPVVAAALFGAPPMEARASAANQAESIERGLSLFDQAQEIYVSQPDRARDLFREAAIHFEAGQNQSHNGRLEFNIGNAWLQAGDVGKAILHYRRAERLIPRDPYLDDNLGTARQRALLKIAPSRQASALRSLLWWHHRLSPSERFVAGLVAYLLCWGALFARMVTRRASLVWLSCGSGMITLALAASLAADSWHDRNSPAGVILSMDVTARRGPGGGYPRQFEQPLQPGVEFEWKEQRGGWWRIELFDGQVCWIESGAAELVPPAEVIRKGVVLRGLHAGPS